MYKIEYSEPSETETAADIVLHNLKKADEQLDLKMFAGSQAGYFELNPTHGMQDLEIYLRNNNFGSHLIASPVSDILTNYTLGFYNKKDDPVEYKYEAIISCRPKEYAVAELLRAWPSYEKNFEELKYAAFVIVNDESETNATSTDKLRLIDKNDPMHRLRHNKTKISYVNMSTAEALHDVCEDIKKSTGKEPTTAVIAMRNGPIMAFVVDGKIMSSIGMEITHDSGGKQIINLVDLNRLKI